jgi:hypothetical protein
MTVVHPGSAQTLPLPKVREAAGSARTLMAPIVLCASMRLLLPWESQLTTWRVKGR